MPDKNQLGKNQLGDDTPLNLDSVLEELGRVPIIGPASDRELFLDLPSAGLAPPQIAGCQLPVEREFLSNDFS
jgi:hypothetical protein